MVIKWFKNLKNKSKILKKAKKINIKNFWKRAIFHVLTDAPCPIDGLRIEAFDMLIERIDSLEKREDGYYLKKNGFSVKISEEDAQEFLRIMNNVKEIIENLKSEYQRNGKIPMICPQGHLLFYSISENKFYERKEETDYDKFLKILIKYGFVHSI